MGFTTIKETCLYIRDLERAYNYYHELLGFDVIDYLKDKHLFLRVGDSMLLCFNPSDSSTKVSPPPHFAVGPQHLAFEVTTLDYEKTKKELLEKGIQIIDEVTWKNGKRSFYFNDPEGNVLEVVPQGIWD